MSPPIKAWHFINNDFTIKTDSMKRPIKVHRGQTLVKRGPLELCERGLHASIKPLDAIYYAPGNVVCRVECSGDVIQGEDKLVCSRRRVLWVVDAERTLHEFAIWCAKQTLRSNSDLRSIEAVRVKRLWLDGEATGEELKEASEAAKRTIWESCWPFSKLGKRSAYAASWPDPVASAQVASGQAARLLDEESFSSLGVVRLAQNDRLTEMLLALPPRRRSIYDLLQQDWP